MKKNNLTIVATCIGIFLCMLDTTIMNIALPAIQTGLKVNLNLLEWALNIYTILFATLTIPISKLAEKFGMKKVYLMGLSAFLVGSLVSAASPDIRTLIIGRGIQSIGAATVFPLSMTIGISTSSVNNRQKTIAALGVTQGLAAALGPIIGGLLTQLISWRWIFIINIPFMIVSIVICLYSLTYAQKNENVPIDFFGSIMSMICLFCFTLVLVQGRVWGWLSNLTITMMIIAILSSIVFVTHEKKVKYPMIPMRLFSDKQFNAAAISIVLSNLFLVAVTVILPTYFTKIQGTTELYAAMVITPITLMIFIFSPIAAIIIKRVDTRLIIFTGFFSMFLAYVMLTKINMHNQLQVIMTCALLGFGYGIITGPITVLAASDFTGEILNASQSVSGVLRQVGVTLAIAIFVTGLYSNINIAEVQSINYGKKEISSLNLPNVQSENMIKLTIQGIKSESKNKKHPKNHVSLKTRNDLIEKQYKTAIPHELEISSSIKQNVLDQVTKQVDVQINETNHRINSVIQKVQKQTKNNYSIAFVNLYLYSIPFLFISMFISFIFKKG